MNISFDPSLKDCMHEIEAILAKYDAGGSIVLNSKTHGEFKIVLPTWSLAKYEFNETGQLIMRVKASKKDLKDPTVHKNLEATVGMLMSLQDISRRIFMFTDQLSKELHKQMEIDHNMVFDRPQ